jgi:hypothetical protein
LSSKVIWKYILRRRQAKILRTKMEIKLATKRMDFLVISILLCACYIVDFLKNTQINVDELKAKELRVVRKIFSLL